jgi:glycosyltransferase involved in cell wall biosynthesis
VVQGKNGFLVPSVDHVALAEAMRKFLESPQIIEEMGTASREMAEELFDVTIQNKRLLSYIGVN